MGCMDRESNFQTLRYSPEQGAWGCVWGPYQVEVPIGYEKLLAERLRSQYFTSLENIGRYKLDKKPITFKIRIKNGWYIAEPK